MVVAADCKSALRFMESSLFLAELLMGDEPGPWSADLQSAATPHGRGCGLQVRAPVHGEASGRSPSHPSLAPVYEARAYLTCDSTAGRFGYICAHRLTKPWIIGSLRVPGVSRAEICR